MVRLMTTCCARKPWASTKTSARGPLRGVTPGPFGTAKKGPVHRFRNRFGLKNLFTGEAVSAYKEAAATSPAEPRLITVQFYPWCRHPLGSGGSPAAESSLHLHQEDNCHLSIIVVHSLFLFPACQCHQFSYFFSSFLVLIFGHFR